jgi:hypothetical protein
MERSNLIIRPGFAVWLGVLWLALICDAAGISYVLRHADPRVVILYRQSLMARSDLICTWIPLLGGLLAIVGLLARRRWGWALAVTLNLALAAGAFAVSGTAFWMARPYGVGGQIVRPSVFGIPMVALIVFFVLLAPGVRRAFR